MARNSTKAMKKQQDEEEVGMNIKLPTKRAQIDHN